MPSRRPTTATRPAITTERIVAAALEIAAESGYDEVSMRSVADRLDTGPASLYVHVANKSELDRLVVTHVMRDRRRLPPDPEAWRAYFVGDALTWLDRLADYPGLARAAFASLPSSEEYLGHVEERLSLLRTLGMGTDEAVVVEALLSGFVAARSMEDAAIEARILDSGLSREQWWAGVRGLTAGVTDRFPTMSESLRGLDGDRRARITVEILELILDGVEARYLSGSAPRPPPDRR